MRLVGTQERMSRRVKRRRGVTGLGSVTSSCRVCRTPWGWVTSGGSPTSASRMVEVSQLL